MKNLDKRARAPRDILSIESSDDFSLFKKNLGLGA